MAKSATAAMTKTDKVSFTRLPDLVVRRCSSGTFYHFGRVPRHKQGIVAVHKSFTPQWPASSTAVVKNHNEEAP